MSIATLKRKTLNGNPRLAPISGQGSFGFALNGTLRNVGVVGPTNLGAKKEEKDFCCTNNSNYIKQSVKNTKGMLALRKINYLSGECPNPINWFQPIDNGYNKHHTQGQYIERKHTESFICNLGLSNESIPGPCKSYEQKGDLCQHNCKSNYIGTRNLFRGNYTKSPPVAISHGEYIRTVYLKNKCIPVPQKYKSKFAHFPPYVNNKGCAKQFISVKKAIDASIL